MTKKELINTYLASIGRTRVQGDSTEPLLPFLLGDAIYTKDIAPLKLRQEEKRLRNHWAQNYTRFNRPFFAAIGGDGSDQVTDLMDDFEDAISNNVMMLRRTSKTAGRFKPGHHGNPATEFKPGHQLTPEQAEKRAASCRAAWARRKQRDELKHYGIGVNR